MYRRAEPRRDENLPWRESARSASGQREATPLTRVSRSVPDMP